MNIVNTQIAYILHKRSYRETSSILEVFTKDYGRVSLMARGSRGARSKIAGNLLLFTPLVINWQGRGNLPYLKSAERADLKAPVLKNKSLLSAMYINELLMYLLHKDDVQSEIFEHYHHCLFSLNSDDGLELTLRLFELKLLELLGFGLNLRVEADTGEAIHTDNMYDFHIEHGLVKNAATNLNSDQVVTTIPRISGRCLLDLENEQHQTLVSNSRHLTELKLLLRHVIAHYLGNKKLKSRELFKPVIRSY